MSAKKITIASAKRYDPACSSRYNANSLFKLCKNLGFPKPASKEVAVQFLNDWATLQGTGGDNSNIEHKQTEVNEVETSTYTIMLRAPTFENLQELSLHLSLSQSTILWDIIVSTFETSSPVSISQLWKHNKDFFRKLVEDFPKVLVVLKEQYISNDLQREILRGYLETLTMDQASRFDVFLDVANKILLIEERDFYQKNLVSFFYSSLIDYIAEKQKVLLEGSNISNLKLLNQQLQEFKPYLIYGAAETLEKLDPTINFITTLQPTSNLRDLQKYLKQVGNKGGLHNLYYDEKILSFISSNSDVRQSIKADDKKLQVVRTYYHGVTLDDDDKEKLKLLLGGSYLNEFDQLYKENQDKLYLSKSYPLDEENWRLWIEKQPTKCSKLFALLFRKYTTHVSFPQFLDRLYKLCYDIKLHIVSESFINVVLLVPNVVSKSNTWVSLLAYKVLQGSITHVFVSQYDVIEFLNDEIETRNRKTLVLYADDCSYSGAQVSDFLTYALRRFIPDPEENAQPKIKCILLIPFMSRTAYNRIFKPPMDTLLMISSETHIFETFHYKLKEEDLMNCQSEFKEIIDQLMGGTGGDDRCTIYFDHKLADYVSIFDTLYASGQVFIPPEQIKKELKTIKEIGTDDEKSYYENDHDEASQEYTFASLRPFHFISLISNCKMPKQEGSARDVHSFLKANAGHCPPAFYKHIKYTFHNIPIDASLGLNKLK
jgi:hypothetical protein